MAGAAHIHLTFHGIGAPPRRLADGEDAVWVSIDRFEATLDSVRSRPDVRITFDDSNRSDVEIALPALQRRGLTATFFVLAGRLDDPAHLSADDVRALQTAGMTVGSHGMDHVDWRTIDDRALDRELAGAAGRLEQICGRPVRTAAIPYGGYDRRVLSALRRHRYVSVFSSDGGPARPGSWLVPRTSLRRDDGPAQVTRILCPDRSLRGLASRRARTAVKRWR